MRTAIKVIHPPEWFGVLEIRKRWVGAVIPIVPSSQIKNTVEGERISKKKAGGYYSVTCRDAVLALREIGQNEAADFWQWMFQPLTHLQFNVEACEKIEIR